MSRAVLFPVSHEVRFLHHPMIWRYCHCLGFQQQQSLPSPFRTAPQAVPRRYENSRSLTEKVRVECALVVNAVVVFFF